MGFINSLRLSVHGTGRYVFRTVGDDVTFRIKDVECDVLRENEFHTVDIELSDGEEVDYVKMDFPNTLVYSSDFYITQVKIYDASDDSTLASMNVDFTGGAYTITWDNAAFTNDLPNTNGKTIYLGFKTNGTQRERASPFSGIYQSTGTRMSLCPPLRQ